MVTINKVDYEVKTLSMQDIFKLNQEKKDIKEGDVEGSYKYTFYTLLYILKKFNDSAKGLTVDDLMELIKIDEFEELQKKILDASGMNKYFKQGDSKK